MSWWLKPVAACVSAAIVLSAAEVAVRARQYVRDGTFFEIGGHRAADPATGLVIPEPGSSSPRIHINSLGFRGPDIAMPKPAGTVRLAFVGASTTFCAEVSGDDHVWPQLVWRELSARYRGVTFDFVNAGIPGAMTASSRVNFERRVHPLDPDVVVLYEGFNDVVRDTRAFASAQGLHVPRAEESGLAAYSLFWRLITKNVQVIAARRAASSGPRLDFPDTLAARFERDLRQLIDEAAKDAPVVAVATLASALREGQAPERQSEMAAAAQYYMPFMGAADLIETYEIYNASIRRAARERGAILIDGEQSITPDPEHFRDTIHFADAGSAQMAARVIDGLVRSPAFNRLIAAGVE